MLGRMVAVLITLALTACSTPNWGEYPYPEHPEKLAKQSDWANECGEWADWEKPAEPFPILGNTFYVGTCGITSILITGQKGHILIDGGTEKGADLIAENIRKLGFKLTDIKIILFSHEHHDHVGGIAQLQELTGAIVLSSKRARAGMETGSNARGDPQESLGGRFPPVKIAGLAEDNMAVELGNLKVFMLESPGHTPGAMSWWWISEEGAAMVPINYLDSLSAVSADDYKFSDRKPYVRKFRESLDRLEVMGCGILLTPHPSASQMIKRAKTTGLIEDSISCGRYIEDRRERLNARLAKEAEEKAKE